MNFLSSSNLHFPCIQCVASCIQSRLHCWWNALIKCFDRVLVEKVAVEKTKAGILLPEKAQGAVNEAVVIAVGPGIKNKLSMIRVCNARSGARNERSI